MLATDGPPPSGQAAVDTEGRPHLPKMISVGDVFAPAAPVNVEATGIDGAYLSDLALKFAYTTSQFSTEWAAQRLQLPQAFVGEILEQLKSELMLEVLGSLGRIGFRYRISARGRERAAQLFEVSGYVGPAPVSLEAYTAMIEWQLENSPAVSPEQVTAALSELVLPEEAVRLAGLALSSGRSLFVFGPPGNGKTALSRMLHNALTGDIWIPHCIVIDDSIIRMYDPQCHVLADFSPPQPWLIDHRWVRIRRPLIVVGGELTIDALDLSRSATMRYYEAPVHVKSNGGILLVDDFGRQRVEPRELLNRWIIPLEHQIDHLTLQSGQKVDVPFRQMLIFATNLDPQSVTDPAFLRRMGYRLQLPPPSPKRYAAIFTRFAAKFGAVADPALIARLLDRYKAEGRELRSCEPRDLIERVRDICRYLGQPLELTDEVFDIAWAGYFGNDQPPR